MKTVKVIDAKMGEGKAQRYSDLVMTEFGYKTIEELLIGDKIYGEDGNLHDLMYKIPQGKKSVYEVKFSDNTKTYCCKDHLWNHQTQKDKAKGVFRTSTLEDIMSMELYKTTNRGDKNWQVFIPMTNPIIMPERDLKIDPYFLGVLLGDGCMSSKTSTITLSCSEQDILSHIKTDGLNIKITPSNSRKGNYLFYNRDGSRGFNKLKLALKELGVYGCLSYDKFIPDEYLYSSVNQRLDLLSGLIDTDGEVNGNNYTFSTTSKKLRDDVIFLVQSLGGTARSAVRQTHYTYKNVKKKGRISYRLGIKLPNNMKAFKSKKHIDKFKTGNTNPHRSIRDIKYIGDEECCCIKTSNPSSLYLTNDFIVTHNSSYAIQYMNDKTLEGDRFIYVTPYLDEVERVKKSCGFVEPYNENYGGKLKSLKKLLASRQNICTTHALFKLIDEEATLLIEQGYTLILDEVLDVVSESTLGKGDIDNLIKLGILNRDESNKLIAGSEKILKEKSTDDNKYRNLAYNLLRHNLEIIENKHNVAIMWLFPVDLLNAFDDVFILTFMFDGYPMKNYLDVHSIPQQKFGVMCLDNSLDYKDRRYKLKDYEYPDMSEYKKLIHLVQKGKMIEVGKKENSFSKSWWDRLLRDKNHEDWITLKKNTVNFLKRFAPSSSRDRVIWTAFESVKVGMYTSSLTDENYLAQNLRATNEYKDRDIVIYMVGKYYNPIIKNWFNSKDLKVDENQFALAEMTQFIWRSAIREDKEIWLYIPNVRMRRLLIQFLNG